MTVCITIHIHGSLSQLMAISAHLLTLEHKKIATDTRSIVFTEYCGLYNDLYDLCNDQQYTVHCLAAMMTCILRLECKNITVT